MLLFSKILSVTKLSKYILKLLYILCSLWAWGVKSYNLS